VYLVVAGPDDGDGPAFEAAIRRHGLADRVRLVGPIYGDDKHRLLARATVFCLPSRQEGFSNAILEALAVGTPCVVSKNSNFSEVQHAGAGLVTGLDAGEVASALGTILTSPAHAEMERCARELAAHYQWPQVVRQVAALYESILRDRADGTR
jgi:glycosyltransferase involved in cell wall biosynthesis